MNLVLTNPWGLLGLLGVPALILIYYLRRKSQVVTVSTLFLLKKTQRETSAGRRFEVFNNSLPFWLQLLGVLILTWLLVQPKYGARRSIQQIAIVIDSSASMQPLRENLVGELKPQLARLRGEAEHASYILLDHDPRRPRLYQGDDSEALLKSLKQWNPTDGALDPTASLRIARSLVGPGGVVVYLTDHDGPALPLSSRRLALGSARANVGFTGVTMNGRSWSAMLRNYSDSPQTRSWTLETPDRQRSQPKEVTVPPRKFIRVKGRLPDGQTRSLLRITGDDFPLDDIFPLVEPQPRVARLSLVGENDLASLQARIVRGFAHVTAADELEKADLILTTLMENQKPASERAMIADSLSSEPAKGRILVDEHPLVSGLNWQSLVVRNIRRFEPTSDDVPLVWLDEVPLILLRRDAVTRKQQLLFAFSLTKSNALKLSATVVLLHRFSETIAQNTLTPSAGFLEASQLIGPKLPDALQVDDLKITLTDLAGNSQELPVPSGFRNTLRAPAVPGFVSLTHREEPLMEAAVHFADTREADLSAATNSGSLEGTGELIESQTREDRFWRWFVLGLLVLLLAAWHALSRKAVSATPSPLVS